MMNEQEEKILIVGLTGGAIIGWIVPPLFETVMGSARSIPMKLGYGVLAIFLTLTLVILLLRVVVFAVDVLVWYDGKVKQLGNWIKELFKN